MRNIEQYPITAQEVMDAIATALQREMDDDRVGGIDGICLEGIRNYLIDNPRAVATIVESLKV